MKWSKKTITTLSFTIGACLFVSTAFADTLLGSGYDQLKSSAKTTAAQMETGLNNYTLEALFSLKDNNQVLQQATSIQKIDTIKKASEETSSDQNSNGVTTSRYTYSDPKMSIYKSGRDDIYYVSEYPNDVGRTGMAAFQNPFDKSGAAEVEKIVDAVVGNLKDYVQAEEKPDGSKSYSGSLSAAQVPAVVNAVSSFGIKQMINDQLRSERNTNLPEITSDIFVKKVTGTAVETKAGILENVTGDVTLTGKDKSGAEHDLTLKVVLKLSDIGTTKVMQPDLSNAKSEKVVKTTNGFSSKNVGTYKNDIIEEKNGKIVKIGERTLVITSVDNGKITGSYAETVKPGFEADYPDRDQFTFEYTDNNSQSLSTFTYTNAKGEKLNGRLNQGGLGRMYLDLNLQMMDNNSYRSNSKPNFDGEFNRVFAE
ncbi:hypothetical protein [Paenibacillus cremeus]|uniref:Uncharacterized protein n=1 Tax=Paenibacillus cremeus TaxID=2163881 RepID=A0A559K5F3_9BACL|nr:hypothetical protein [Paenibacillus cremeus]TVY07364.1 hypothetical protein FPZ49_24280 [Paenibacillus cremeus]